MFFVSNIYKTAPDKFSNPFQEKTCQTLEELHIPFERAEMDEAITMEDCIKIDA